MASSTPHTEDDVKDTTRVDAFSDGVFAIAITLLVLEIRIPEPEEGTALAELLLHEWPSYLAYFISFMTIGIMWMNHHHLFKYICRTDNIFLLLNIVLLMLVTFLNFPTFLLAEYLQHEDQKIAALMYGGTFVATAITFNVLWWYASHKFRLLSKNADPTFVNSITRQYRFGPILYLLATGLVFVSVFASLAVHLFLAIFFALTGSIKNAR